MYLNVVLEKVISSEASILITIGTAHDLNVRDRAGEIGIPFTSGMRITLAEGRGFVECYIESSRKLPYHGAATERQNIVGSYLRLRTRKSSHSSLLITENLT